MTSGNGCSKPTLSFRFYAGAINLLHKKGSLEGSLALCGVPSAIESIQKRQRCWDRSRTL